MFVRWFVHNIKHMMTPKPDRILRCYGEYQAMLLTVIRNGTFCTTTMVRKKAREYAEYTSGYDVTSGHVTSNNPCEMACSPLHPSKYDSSLIYFSWDINRDPLH
jgi:hypothetical protein